MFKHLFCVMLAIALLGSHARAATPQQIDAAITKAKKFIYSQQKNGNWELVQARDDGNSQSPNNGQFTGRTALALLALINAGESNQDPRIQQGIQFLIKTPTEGTYALGLRCQLWFILPPSNATRDALLRDAKVLLGSVKTDGHAKGMYDYTPGTGKSYSHSRSQYAVLGMWAASQAGAEVPDNYWHMIEEGWQRNQDKSGGWGYMHPSDSKFIATTPGMTTVGVASLIITQEQLRGPDGVACKGNQTSKAIDDGIAWLGKNMDKFATDKPYERDFPFVTLYAYERVGVASGLRYFGGIDWYEKGSTWAIKKQNADGSWPADISHLVPLVDTSFVTLFLSKGRAPLVISKLAYTDPSGKFGKWNQRTRDAANFVRWMGRTIERDLAFQIVDLKASLSDMLESPILYIAGSDALNLTPEDEAKIKAYIEGGGIVFANADCATPAFVTSIKKVAKNIFPDSEFSELPADDPIYTSYYPRNKWKTKPSVLTLSNGARQQIVLIPQADPAKAWALDDKKGRTEMFELMGDLLLYSVDRQNLRNRGERFYIPDDAKAKALRTIDVVRVKYPGFWDPEPGGWRRLNNLLKITEQTEIATSTAELTKNEFGEKKIAHLTGTYEYKFSDAQCEELKKFVDGGGTLVIDVAGGNSKFATSVETAIATMFPKDKLETLAPDHALFTAGGGEADAIEYRQFARRNGVGKITTPRLQGITINNRLAVIYSREDLSVGLVGQEIDGIVGYTPEVSTALMTRILNFVDGRPVPKPKSATTKPATAPAAPAAGADDEKPEKKTPPKTPPKTEKPKPKTPAKK